MVRQPLGRRRSDAARGPICLVFDGGVHDAGILDAVTLQTREIRHAEFATPEQVRERLEEMVAMGANHLLLNPVSRYAEQLEALAEVVGLK